MSRYWAISAVLVLLTGCGFAPLHGPQKSGVEATSALHQISVPPIPERLGQLLRIELTNRLNPEGAPLAPAYTLRVKVSENKRDLAVRKDATATRANLIISASFQLTQIQDKKDLIKGTVRSVNSYDILDADLATLSAESDARRRAARDLAIEIKSRLGIFLTQQSSP